MIRGFILLSLLLSPLPIYANIQITEIMYDLEGSDSKREWIELYNGGTVPVDITDWRFNDGSNHTLVGDDLLIEADSFVLLVSDKDTYGVSAKVIDTVMSLNNTTDTISIVDTQGVVVDSVTYFSEWGANGNGKSLQQINGDWAESAPTPLAKNELETEEVVQTQEDPTVTTSTEELEARTYTSRSNAKITADAGGDKSGVASSLIFFDGLGFGIKNDLLTNARYLWNFGDGHSTEGQHVSHTYTYPNTYTGALTVTSGEFSDTDYFSVDVREADVEIVYADRGKIEIENKASVDLDISFWRLKYKDALFTFPNGTIIKSKRKALFPASATNIPVDVLNEVTLLYPNGLIVSRYLRQAVHEEIVERGVEQEKIIEYVYVQKEIQKAPAVEETNISIPTDIPSTTTLTALSIGSGESQASYKWLVALVSLIAVASLVALSSPRFQKDSDAQEKLSADDFKIVE